MACLYRVVFFTDCISFIKGKKTILGMFQQVVSTLGNATSNVALPSVLITCYCIPQKWQTVLHQICSTTDPFDLSCESVTCKL